MANLLENGIKWLKAILIRFLYVNPQEYFTCTNPKWVLAQKRNILPLGFLLSFWGINISTRNEVFRILI